MNISVKRPWLYAITDSRLLREGMSLAGAVELAAEGGADIIQLREKNKPEEEIIRSAGEIMPVCRRYGIPLIINDSVKIAYKVGADGVHLGLDDSDLLYARRVLGEDAIIGATAHNLCEAQAALAAGADYLGCGAVFGSTTKTDTVPLSIEELTRICGRVSIPVVAIGGVCAENITRLRGTGIAGTAAVSAIFGQEDIKASAAALKGILRSLEL